MRSRRPPNRANIARDGVVTLRCFRLIPADVSFVSAPETLQDDLPGPQWIPTAVKPIAFAPYCKANASLRTEAIVHESDSRLPA